MRRALTRAVTSAVIPLEWRRVSAWAPMPVRARLNAQPTLAADPACSWATAMMWHWGLPSIRHWGGVRQDHQPLSVDAQEMTARITRVFRKRTVGNRQPGADAGMWESLRTHPARLDESGRRRLLVAASSRLSRAVV